MQIEPIRKTSVVQDAISKIKEMIDQGHYKFGDKLPSERELAKILGISLPSLREALRALNILGIAEMKPGSGTYLRSSLSSWSSDPFSLLFDLRKEVHLDLFEARKGIEGITAELAAQKRTEEDLRRMEHALQKMKASVGDKDVYIRHEIEFHQALFRAAKNSILEDLMEKMYKLLYESRKKTVEYLDDIYKDSYLNHLKVYRAIKAKDVKKARRTMVQHFFFVEKRLKEDRHGTLQERGGKLRKGQEPRALGQIC